MGEIKRREISSFGGLDLRGVMGEEGRHRFLRLDNLWRDYVGGEGEILETFPGFRNVTQFSGAIYGIWGYTCDRGAYLAIHAGRSLYLMENSLISSPFCPSGAEEILQPQTSCAFSWGNKLYLLDGASYFVLEDGEEGFVFSRVENAYIPVTYADGVVYEQKNLLCSRGVHRFHLGEAGAFSYVQDGLQFQILDHALRTCEVSGMPRNLPTYPQKLYIPAKVNIGGVEFNVIQVGWKAFSQINEIQEVYISEGVTTIEIAAFDACRGLRVVHLPDSLVEIKNTAFQKCPIEILTVGKGLSHVMKKNFTATETPMIVTFHGDSTSFGNRLTVDSEDNDAYFAATKVYTETYPVRVVYLPLKEKVEEVETITLDDVDVTDGDTDLHLDFISKKGWVEGVLLTGENGYYLSSRVAEVLCRFPTDGEGNPICGCVGACLYDGRAFFYGNPLYPNTIYYSALDGKGQMNPAYVGVYNYFNTGVGNHANKALIPTASYLAVLKENAGDEGAVHFYYGKNTGEALVPRIYEREAFVGTRGCIGGAIQFMDDPVYLSNMGVEALGYQSLSMERNVYHRSSLIDSALAMHKKDPCLMGEWEGYLLLLYPNGEMYLGDSRRTCQTALGREYEWYHLTGMGSYQGDVPVFCYASGYVDDTPPVVVYGGVETPLKLSPHMGEEVEYTSVLTGVDTQGRGQFYIREGDDLYLLCQTAARKGGTFSSPTALFSGYDRLFFGCENGMLCVVNTDKRGVMNASQAAEYTPTEYGALWGNTINYEWYSYGGHPILCGFTTIPDDCGIGNYTKKTKRGTTIIEMKSHFENTFNLQVKTQHGGYSGETESISFWGGGMDFTTLSFEHLTFTDRESPIISVEERTKRWVSKQYSIWSEGIATPFGIRRIGYSYMVEGKVKNK